MCFRKLLYVMQINKHAVTAFQTLHNDYRDIHANRVDLLSREGFGSRNRVARAHQCQRDNVLLV